MLTPAHAGPAQPDFTQSSYMYSMVFVFELNLVPE